MTARELSVALGVCAVAIGVLVGVGLVTFGYANGFSYLSTDPEACVNCHIMRPQFDSWQKSSHKGVATCVDCHLPHTFVAKYVAKVEHGWNHSKGFTLQNFPEPIQITQGTEDALLGNCVRCHGSLVGPRPTDFEGLPHCGQCHSDVGHGPRAGLGGPWRPEEASRETHL